MNILAFSDLHRDIDAAETIVAASSNADVVIGAGDFATRRAGGLDVLRTLSTVKVPLLLVHGNHDDPDELSVFCADYDHIHHLHGTDVTVQGQTFFGLGGEIPARNSAHWNTAETEDTAHDLLKECHAPAVLITHTPPYGVADHQADGRHEGSIAIRDFLQQQQPRLNLCGHIHNAWGASGRVGDTYVHNLGPTLSWFKL